jgi:cytochrome c biogenesis protein ResB
MDIEVLSKNVEDHETRIRILEKNDATMLEQIKGLVKELGNLTAWIKALVILMFGSLVGFVFWYIQSLK